MYIDGELIIQVASVLTAIGVIGGVLLWCFRFVSRQKVVPPICRLKLAIINRKQTSKNVLSV